MQLDHQRDRKVGYVWNKWGIVFSTKSNMEANRPMDRHIDRRNDDQNEKEFSTQVQQTFCPYFGV